MPDTPDDQRPGGHVDWSAEVRAFLPGGLKLAVRICGELNAAEDLVQEALLRVAKSRANFRGDCSPRTWMNRILINVGRDWIRRRSGVRNHVALSETELVVDGKVASATERKETAVEVWNAIAKLPQRQREVVTLSVWQEVSANEIAEILEISVQNVYSNLSAAKQQLRSSLGAEMFD